ncbi:unnamed protein product [Boreogadus saida]
MLAQLNFPSLSLPDIARAIELLEKLQESGDVPGHKLQSLKKVLQSEFCTAIREVYQYMHETITINGCPEFQARATAKTYPYVRLQCISARKPTSGGVVLRSGFFSALLSRRLFQRKK